jgi:hypothetical protein
MGGKDGDGDGDGVGAEMYSGTGRGRGRRQGEGRLGKRQRQGQRRGQRHGEDNGRDDTTRKYCSSTPSLEEGRGPGRESPQACLQLQKPSFRRRCPSRQPSRPCRSRSFHFCGRTVGEMVVRHLSLSPRMMGTRHLAEVGRWTVSDQGEGGQR